LIRPRFDRAEFEKLRTRQIELIKAAKDSDPSDLLGIYGRAFLFEDHPYGRPIMGSEASLAAIDHDEALRFYRSQFGADRLTLIFTGAIDPETLKASVARAFGTWPKAATPAPNLRAAPRVKGRKVILVDSPDSVQTYFWIGDVGVDKRYPHRAALDLVNTLYGGRFTSILNTELRIKSGLSYGASSSFTRGSVPGDFAIRSFAETENTEKAVDMALQTLARLEKEGVTQEALDSARAYVLGQYPLSLETAADWAAALGEIELYGLDKTYIEGYGPALRDVALRDTASVIASAFPRPRNLAIVMIGDAAKIRDVARKYGPVTQIALTDPSFTAPAAARR
jgi:predicted Zn-dependent peptidase